MALYVKIPKDINGIKDTVALNLTKRQLIFYTVGLVLGFGIYWLTYKTLDTTTAAVLLFIVASPFFIIAKYEKNGLTMEKYIANFIRWKLTPQVRPYRTENIYRSIAEKIEYDREVKMLETGRKEVKHKN